MNSNPDQLSKKRHSLAHLLGAAALRVDPGAKLAIGPAVDDGFYYDIELSSPLADKELKQIEKEMRKILPTWKEFTHAAVSADEARKQFEGNPYKTELINELEEKGEEITLYTSGDFTDLCRGGHVENPSQDIAPDSFTLDRVAGAYWRGNEKNKMLTRIYGLAFDTKEELDAYRAKQEEAKARDHRKLGKELDLFTFSELVGPALPLYTPKGTLLRELLAGFSEELQRAHGFQKVWIPHITKIDLYKKSGHWDKFGHELMLVKSQESSDEFALKPMNCPHHAQIYASRPRSYRDLPIRYMETTTCYRDEKTGELSGITRVRSLTQDDGHVFARMDQIEEEFENIMSMIKTMYTTFGMSFHARLSFRDPNEPKKYLGTVEQWDEAERILESIAKKLELDYSIARGEAAFYGPKIDVMVTDALGREWQTATEQLDFLQPERFELEYTAADGTKQTPVMIHKALLGTIDRFLGVYIEHTGGNFPLWLSPVQVRVLPIAEAHIPYAETVLSALKTAGIRAELDSEDVSLGKKIRRTKLEKVPYFLVIGNKEVETSTVTLESRDGASEHDIALPDLTSRLTQENEARK